MQPIRGVVDMGYLTDTPPGFNDSTLRDIMSYNHGVLRPDFSLQEGVVVVSRPDRTMPMRDVVKTSLHNG